ncbi:MAG: hypothetical protein WD448_00745 [Woeseia sp.]
MDATGFGTVERMSSRRWTAAVVLCFFATVVQAQEERLEFTGSASSTTAPFKVEAPWILDWRVFSDFPQSMSIEISLMDAKTGLHEGSVVQTREMGNGVKLFDEGGSYQLRIDADLVRWQILVKELTEEEAEQYTPKQDRFLENSPFRQRERN